jgi:glycogen debranching enzyme
VSEIFDAEPPYTARGCIAQAWSVAELLRAWIKLAHLEQVARSSNPQFTTANSQL